MGESPMILALRETQRIHRVVLDVTGADPMIVHGVREPDGSLVRHSDDRGEPIELPVTTLALQWSRDPVGDASWELNQARVIADGRAAGVDSVSNNVTSGSDAEYPWVAEQISRRWPSDSESPGERWSAEYTIHLTEPDPGTPTGRREVEIFRAPGVPPVGTVLHLTSAEGARRTWLIIGPENRPAWHLDDRPIEAPVIDVFLSAMPIAIDPEENLS